MTFENQLKTAIRNALQDAEGGEREAQVVEVYAAVAPFIPGLEYFADAPLDGDER